MFAAFDYRSFFSVWYWVLTIVVWTLVCHRTLGVPYDMVLRAGRLPRIAADVDAIARASAGRLSGIHDAAGAWIAAAAGFGLAALAVLGFSTRIEAAQAAFMLLLPLAAVGVGTVRLAQQIERGDLRGEPLRRRLTRRRAVNQAIAIAAILASALLALTHHPRFVWG